MERNKIYSHYHPVNLMLDTYPTSHSTVQHFRKKKYRRSIFLFPRTGDLRGSISLIFMPLALPARAWRASAGHVRGS